MPNREVDMRYFKDDIIEIINVGNGFLYHNYPYQIPTIKDYIGQRFRVTFDSKQSIEIDFIKGSDGNYPYLSQSQIMLYHRPFKNWVKNIFSIFKRKGI